VVALELLSQGDEHGVLPSIVLPAFIAAFDASARAITLFLFLVRGLARVLATHIGVMLTGNFT